ncbi:MAG: response regulator [Sulfuricellaceae bacterium]
MIASRNSCLLAVVDDPIDVRLLQLAVQQSPVAVKLFFVGDGSAALRFLRRQDAGFRHVPRPDLILLVNGTHSLEFLAAAKQDEQLRAIPVVVMGCPESEADVRAAYRLGAAGYMQKPADGDEFNGVMDKLIRYWFGRMRLPENDACTGQCGQ